MALTIVDGPTIKQGESFPTASIARLAPSFASPCRRSSRLRT